jgi:WD40 repeat protein
MKRSFALGAFGGFVVVAVCALFAWHMSRPVAVLATSVLQGPPPNTNLALVGGVARSSDGNVLATVSDSKIVQLWDAKTGALLHTLEGEKEWLGAPAFSPDGSVLATTSSVSSFNKQIGRLQLWNPSTGERLTTVEGIDWPKSVKFDPLGNFLVVGANGDLYEVDLSTYGIVQHVSRPHGSRVLTTMDFDPGGTFLATAGQDGSVKLWKMPLLDPVRTFDAGIPIVKVEIPGEGNSPVPATSVAFSHDGKWLAACNQEGTVFVWNVTGGEVARYDYGKLQRGQSIHAAEPNSLAFTSDDRWLITTDRTGTAIRLLSVVSRRELTTPLSTHGDTPILALDASLPNDSVAFVYRVYQPAASKFEIWALAVPH